MLRAMCTYCFNPYINPVYVNFPIVLVLSSNVCICLICMAKIKKKYIRRKKRSAILKSPAGQSTTFLGMTQVSCIGPTLLHACHKTYACQDKNGCANAGSSIDTVAPEQKNGQLSLCWTSSGERQERWNGPRRG